MFSEMLTIAVWEKLKSQKWLLFSVNYLVKKEMVWLFFDCSCTPPNAAEKLLKMLAIKLKFLNIHILPLSELLKLKENI